MRRTPTALAPLALVLAALLLAGCGGEEGPQADPSGTPSAPTGSGEPSSPSEPTVAPATGFDYDLDRITMRAPEGWKRNEGFLDFLVSADEPGTSSQISLSDQEPLGTPPPLEEQARIAVEQSSLRLRVVGQVEIAGAEWFHLTGRDGPSNTYDQFGTTHQGSLADIVFSLADDLSEDERQQLIDSVLATVEWK